jgi:hypothetical protein
VFGFEDRDGNFEDTITELRRCFVELCAFRQWNRAVEVAIAEFRMIIAFSFFEARI